MSFVILMPTRSRTETLHRSRCKHYHRRTNRVSVLTRAQIEPNDGFIYNLHLCPECLPDGIPADLRANLWTHRIKMDHNRLAESRAEFQRWQRRQAAKDAFLAQFEDLRRSCEIVWGRPVRFGPYTHNGNLCLILDSEPFWDVMSIYLTAVDGEHRVRFEGVNHSTGLIRTMDDAEALGLVFTLLKNWRSSAPFNVPTDAPEFYGIR